MRKKLVMMLMILGLAMMTACGGDSKDGLTAADVAGTWEQQMSDGVKTMILREDMTYTETIVITTPMVIQTQTDDTYSLDGDHIVLNYSDYGVSSEYTVILTEDTMTLDNGQAQIVYKKK